MVCTHITNSLKHCIESFPQKYAVLSYIMQTRKVKRRRVIRILCSHHGSLYLVNRSNDINDRRLGLQAQSLEIRLQDSMSAGTSLETDDPEQSQTNRMGSRSFDS